MIVIEHDNNSYSAFCSICKRLVDIW